MICVTWYHPCWYQTLVSWAYGLSALFKHTEIECKSMYTTNPMWLKTVTTAEFGQCKRISKYIVHLKIHAGVNTVYTNKQPKSIKAVMI